MDHIFGGFKTTQENESSQIFVNFQVLKKVVNKTCKLLTNENISKFSPLIYQFTSKEFNFITRLNKEKKKKKTLYKEKKKTLYKEKKRKCYTKILSSLS